MVSTLLVAWMSLAAASPAEVLDDALGDKDVDLRSEALHALGVAKTPTARAKLEEALKDHEGKLRFGAARGLAAMKDPNTAPAVAGAWRKEKGWAVKKELAMAAGASGAKELIPSLKEATSDSRLDLAAAAAYALADLGDPSAPELLKKLGNPLRKDGFKEGVDRWSRKVLSKAKDGDPVLAARTLAIVGVATDKPLLEKQLENTDARVRLWAAAGLLRLER